MKQEKETEKEDGLVLDHQLHLDQEQTLGLEHQSPIDQVQTLGQDLDQIIVQVLYIQGKDQELHKKNNVIQKDII